jgi:hypothetical protein
MLVPCQPFGPEEGSRFKLELEKGNFEQMSLNWMELHNERVTVLDPVPLP